MATAEQFAAVQQQLEQSRQHTAALTTNIDTVREQASAAVGELSGDIAAFENQIKSINTNGKPKEKEMNLINLKSLEPKIFAGAKDENYKTWAKRLKT